MILFISALADEKAVGIFGIIGEVNKNKPAKEPTANCFEFCESQSIESLCFSKISFSSSL